MRASHIFTPILGLLIIIVSLFTPIFMLIALPFIKWDKEESTTEKFEADGKGGGSMIQYTTLRGDLPSIFKWLETPDERLPGGLYEATVKDVFDKYGKYICSFYWLGLRNQMMGLAAALGQKTSDYIPEEPLGYWERDNIWRYSIAFGPIKFVTGFQVYKVLDGTFTAVPVFTLKRYNKH